MHEQRLYYYTLKERKKKMREKKTPRTKSQDYYHEFSPVIYAKVHGIIILKQAEQTLRGKE